ncbi:MAG: DUF4386 domain-containing protein [Salinibacterium sp.]|nr:DUF4386 domain-containing protein [Salinibacterium sp.]
MKAHRTAARSIGILMLAAFFLYGIGTSVAITATAGSAPLVIGVGMMLLNTLAVIAIGILMYPIVRPHSAIVAGGYLTTRLFEGTLLAIGATALLTGAAAINTLAYNIAMAGLGIGSLFFCVVLYRARLVPRFLAAWGFIGYAAFASGCVLEIVGVAGAGIPATIPGGLFELAFAGWLLVRGFASRSSAPVAVNA